MEIHEEKISEIEQFSNEDRLLEGLQALSAYLNEHNVNPKMRDETETMLTNYNMMLDYYKSGMVDPKRDEIFEKISCFLRTSSLNLNLFATINKSSTLVALKKRGDKLDLRQLDVLIHEKRDDPEFLNALFSAIVTSWYWTDEECDYFTDIITDPTTDYKVASLMLSALAISFGISSDIRKSICLCNSYRRLKNPKLKQRAFVGWTFSSCLWPIEDFDKLTQLICEMCKEKTFVNEVVEMQKQVFLCINAEKDAKAVDDRILEHFKNGDLTKMKGFNIEDKSLNDILHPEQEDEKVEKLEKTITGMMNMQKAGSDVYFNGFAQMKGFAFFHSMYNWFIPYYKENPVLQPLLKALDGNEKMLQNIQDNSPFCEGDKYSFSLAIDFSMHKSLAPIKDILKEGFLFGNSPLWCDETDENTIARRMYLQDLYRFCKLSSFKGLFLDYFNTENDVCLNFSMFIFRLFLHGNQEALGLDKFDEFGFDEMLESVGLADEEDEEGEEVGEEMDVPEELKYSFLQVKQGIHSICDFLVKHKQYKRLKSYLEFAGDLPYLDCDFYNCVAEMYADQKYHTAYMTLEMLKRYQPDDVVITKLLAKCACETKDYQGACEYFRELVERTGSDTYRLKYASCLLKCEEADKALSILFELNYKYSNNEDIIRSLAWGKVLKGEYEDAISKYDSLICMADGSQKKVVSEDFYNEGLCYLLLGKKAEAINLFRDYSTKKSEDEPDIYEKMEDDIEFLDRKGISEYDRRLIADCIFLV